MPWRSHTGTITPSLDRCSSKHFIRTTMFTGCAVRRHVRTLAGPDEAARLPPGPTVVVAPLESLAAGASRRLLVAWGGDARNAIVLPGRPRVRERKRILVLSDQMFVRMFTVQSLHEPRRKNRLAMLGSLAVSTTEAAIMAPGCAIPKLQPKGLRLTIHEA